MSFIYPRIVAIRRAQVSAAVGMQAGYSGVTAATEDVIATGLPASIQWKRARGKPEGDTPSNAPERAGWQIFIPKPAATLGLITERDIVVDDLGKRYTITAAYWNSLGYNITAELLQA